MVTKGKFLHSLRGSGMMTGRDFREHRFGMKMTQTELADALGCTRKHIHNLENGEDVPVHWGFAMLYLVGQNAPLHAVSATSTNAAIHEAA